MLFRSFLLFSMLLASTPKTSALWHPRALWRHRRLRRTSNSDTNLCLTPMGPVLIGPHSYDEYGEHVSMSFDGKILAVGARSYQRNASFTCGLVRVYKYETNTNGEGSWRRLGNDIEGENDGDWLFTNDLSDDGEILAVGAPGYDSYRGQVRVYKLVNGAVWDKMGDAIIGDKKGNETGGKFGYSLSLSGDGDCLAVGAYEHGEGNVRVFERTGFNWATKGRTIKGREDKSWFGRPVSLSQDGHIMATAAMKSGNNGNESGTVRVFEFTANDWEQLGQDLNGVDEEDWYGEAIALSSDGHTIAIGSPWADPGLVVERGQVHVFRFHEKRNRTWLPWGQSLNGTIAFDNFGDSVSLSGDGKLLAIGASGDYGVHDRGRAFVYQMDDVTMTWKQIGDFVEGLYAGDNLGRSVAVSRDGSTFCAGGDAWDTGRRGLAMIFNVASDACLSEPIPSVRVQASLVNVTMVFQGAGKLLPSEVPMFENLTEDWFERYFTEWSGRKLQERTIEGMDTEIQVTGQEVSFSENQAFLINTINYNQQLEYSQYGDPLHTAYEYLLVPYEDNVSNLEYASELASNFLAFRAVQTPLPLPIWHNNTAMPGKGVNLEAILGAGIPSILAIVALAVYGWRKRHRGQPTCGRRPYKAFDDDQDEVELEDTDGEATTTTRSHPSIVPHVRQDPPAQRTRPTNTHHQVAFKDQVQTVLHSLPAPSPPPPPPPPSPHPPIPLVNAVAISSGGHGKSNCAAARAARIVLDADGNRSWDQQDF